MRATFFAIAALAFLRIVVGMHFALEGTAHLRDPEWSSAGFRRAAVGPLAQFYRRDLPQTGDWSATLGEVDIRPVAESTDAWQESVVASWKKLLDARCKRVALNEGQKAAAEEQLAAATQELKDYLAGIADDLADYRLQIQRLATMEQSPGAAQIPFVRDRVSKKRRELSVQSAGWMNAAAAIGQKLVSQWDDSLPPAGRLLADRAVSPTAIWQADQFVSWSLVTIGACLVLGLFTKFNALGGVCFLASVVAAQPFWVGGAQATYNQWVEIAALLALAALPVSGWSGLDYFLQSFSKKCFTKSGCCSPKKSTR